MTLTRDHLAALEALIEEHITLLGYTNATARSAQLALCAQAKAAPGAEALALSQDVRARFEQIEHEVAQGKHTAMSVFTQMRTAAICGASPPAPDAELIELLSDALPALQRISDTAQSLEDFTLAERFRAKLAQLRNA